MNLLREKQRLLPLCGLMITSPSTSTRQETKTENVTNATDRRVVADGGSIVVGENSNVTLTDLNSVQKAADLGQTAIINATKVATTATESSGTLASKAIDLTGSAFSELSRAYQEANSSAQSVASGNRTLVIGAAILAGLMLLNKMGKRA